MKIDMTAPILDISGEPLSSEGNPVILRTIVQAALLATTAADANLDGAKKARMFTLAMEANKDAAEFKIEDIALIKERIGMVSTPLAVGRSYELLDPPEDE